ncbi:MAG: MqnA/MqnD/SBP family protein [Opitutales bacterium]
MSKLLKIGVNAYINNLPLRCAFAKNILELDYETYLDYPAYLTKKCEEGFFDISSISFWAYARLKENYKLLPNFCICANGEIKSVKILANCPLEDFAKKKIFITDQSGSSARAFIYYCRQILKFDPRKSRVDDMQNADVVFLIGDTALKCDESKYKYYYDFGTLFKEAFNVPLVYGAIAVKREIYDEVSGSLIKFFNACLEDFKANENSYYEDCLKSISNKNLDVEFMRDYFSRMDYKISDEDFAKSLEFLNNYSDD